MRQFLYSIGWMLWAAFHTSTLQAQDFSNKGKDFYITFPAHVDGAGAVMGIYITSDRAATGSVTVGTGGPTLAFNIQANTVRRFFLGNTAANDAPNGVVYQSQLEGVRPGSAIRVTSDVPVVVYAHIIQSARSGSSLILPTNVWGREYLVPSYWSAGASGQSSGRGIITVVAKEANTAVEIIPTATSFDATRIAGVPYTITLDQPGDVYQVQFQKDADISGTVVRSVATGTSACKPIAVFSASTWSAFNCPGPVGGDNLYQQLFPTRSFGRTYIIAPFANRQRDIIRVFTLEPNTTVQKTEGGVTTNLNIVGGLAEYETGVPTRITADKPIMVVQYMNSQNCDTRNPAGCINSSSCPFPADPEMVILSAVEQTLNNVTVFSAHRNFVPPNQSNVNQCFLNIVIPTAGAASFRINGAPPTSAFVPIPGTGFSFLQADVSNLSASNPVQSLSADSNFSCIAYGYGQVESYGYNAGTNVRDLFQFISIRDANRSVDAANTCQNSRFRWYITLPFQATRLEWQFKGAFPDAVVPAPVPDSTYVRDGKTLYRYLLQGEYAYPTPGQRTITVLVTNQTSDGCAGEQQLDFDVEVIPQPTSNFTINHSGCLSDSARFVSSGTVAAGGGTISTWNWFFGDGGNGTGNVNSISYKYQQSGTYEVKHLVRSSLGCVSDTGRNTIVINPTPVAAFNMAGPFCQGRELVIANTSSVPQGTLQNWFWDMGNGTVFNRNSGATFNYAYPEVGTYQIKHVVRSSTGCLSDTVRQTITVTHVPVPGFTLPDVCLNDAFAEFENTTTIGSNNLNNITWLWRYGNPNANAGNPNTSNLLTGRHRYTAADNYQVRLIATTVAGCADSITQTLTVNGDRPLAAFNMLTTGNLCSNLPVSIQNKSTVNFGNITRVVVYWDNAVNNTDSTDDPNPVFDKIYTRQYAPFASPATRTVQIRMQAFSGTVCVNDLVQNYVLHATPNVQFATIPGICLDAAPRQLTQGSDAAGNTGTGIYSGTGISAAGLFTPTISGAGTFPLRYRFTTTAGCTDSAAQNITVWPRPAADFAIADTTCIGSPIQLRSLAVANANALASWNWDFGDGSSLTRANPTDFTRTFTTSQTFTIRLQVSTDSGCISLPRERQVTIHPLPQVAFDVPGLVCLPEGRAAFTNRTTVGGNGGQPLSYLWRSGIAGVQSTSTNATFFYPAVAPYNVTLIATSARGCVDSLTQPVTNIVTQALANWQATPAEVCLGDTIRFRDLSNALGNTITGWTWQFGDGASATVQNPSRLYAVPGTYAVSMFYSAGSGCFSDTITRNVVVHPIPVANAGPDVFLLQGGELTLQATATGSTNYTYLWTPNTWLNDPTLLQPITRAENDITYRLTVAGAGGCSSSDEVTVRILLRPIIPNAFSPNGDGINDTWIIRNLESYQGATVQVFDRYGRIIYSSVGYNTPWDGTHGGKPVPSGVYYYIIDPKNGVPRVSGSVTLLR